MPNTLKYRWKPGTRIKLNAQKIGEHLEKLQQANGGELTPAMVVNDATKKNSPLHSYFDWNNKSAAAKYRIEQAKYLIRHVTVVVRINNVPTPMRDQTAVRLEDPTAPNGVRYSYVKTVQAMSQPATREFILSQALADLMAFKHKYQHLNELGEIFAAMDKLEQKVSKRSRTIKQPRALVAIG